MSKASLHYLEKELYELVKRDERIFDFLQAGSLDGIWYWDMENPEHEWMSPAFWRILGYDPEAREHLAAEWQNLIHPEDLVAAQANVEQHLNDANVPYDQEVRYRHRDGSTVWVRCRGLAIRDAAGKPTRMLGAHNNITNLKRHNDEHRRFKSMFNSTPDLVSFIGLDYRYIEVNDSYLHYWDADRTQLVDRSVEEMLGSDIFVNTVKPKLLKCFNGEKVSYQEWFQFPSLGRRYMDVVYSPGLNEEGEIEGCVVTVRDITDQKKAQNIIEKQNRELNRSNEDLKTFAYIASHDLKSPLRSIRQLADWAIEDFGREVPEAVQNHLGMIGSRITRMENLLDSLLEYSKVGLDDGLRELVNVEHTLKDIYALCAAPEAFRLVIEGTMPVFETSRVAFELVLLNLISNAIKYRSRDDGEVRISLETLPDRYQFCVADNGTGIDKKHHERVFGMFQRLISRDEVEGSGLGLAMVKKWVEHFGGHVLLESQQSDGGSAGGIKFYFTWPISED